eukprot:TRINITY_DN12024_c0_g1_i1.p1 TRINITY_DN12024_c0_g1~~TRINITY_DN12024_c0_g1_i1.p1  ORF type:complete len:740 (+),score=126.84 TRINITY_DN12024_c0_g1_i1:35-2221(+)
MGKAKRGKEISQKELRKNRRKKEREEKKARKDRFTKRFQNVNNSRKEGKASETPPVKAQVSPKKTKKPEKAKKSSQHTRPPAEVKRRKNVVHIDQKDLGETMPKTPEKIPRQVSFNFDEDVRFMTPSPVPDDGKMVIPSAAPAVSKPQAYVPPSLRAKGEASPKDKLMTDLKSIINRLSADTIKYCAQEIIDLNSKTTLSRFEFSQALNTIMITSICDQVRLVSSFIFPYSALIKVVSASLGESFSAELCASLCCALRDQLSSGERNRSINSILFLSHLHATKVTDATLVYSVIRKLSKFKNPATKELQLELLLVLISVGGAQLKADSATALKDISDYVKDRLQRSQSLETSARANVLVELLQALKTSKGQKNFGAESRRMDVACKDATLRSIGSILSSMHIKDPTVHTITYNVCVGDRIGMWWLSIARGHTKENDESDSDQGSQSDDEQSDFEEEHSEEESEGESSSEMAVASEATKSLPIGEIVAKHRVFNTELRRLLFKTICAAEDTQDCIHNLLRLNLKGHDESELVFVLLHCLTHERIFNPFYVNVLNRLSGTNRRWKFTLMYSYWDRWQAIQEADTPNMSEYINLSVCFALLVKNGRCSLAHLKGPSWDKLSTQLSLCMKILWIVLAMTIPNLADDVRTSIALSSEMDLFRGNLQKWIHSAFLADAPSRISLIAKVLSPLLASLEDHLEIDGDSSKPEIVTTIGTRLKQVYQALDERGMDDI